MTKSLIGAIVLNTCLYSFAEEDIPSIFSSRFFMAQNAKTEHVWDYTKKSDYGQETCTPASGETLAMGKLTRWWSAKLGVLQVKGVSYIPNPFLNIVSIYLHYIGQGHHSACLPDTRMVGPTYPEICTKCYSQSVVVTRTWSLNTKYRMMLSTMARYSLNSTH
jgi:hypothetical protein